jgi:hypothetical protein
MSDQKKRLEEGPPIWVESTMTREEWKARYKKYPTSTQPEPTQYDPSYHKGGKWRDRMGAGYTNEEIVSMCKALDNLRELLKTKKFQRRPEYGPESEAIP